MKKLNYTSNHLTIFLILVGASSANAGTPKTIHSYVEYVRQYVNEAASLAACCAQSGITPIYQTNSDGVLVVDCTSSDVVRQSAYEACADNVRPHQDLSEIQRKQDE